jgi:hypothetical protein
MQDMYLERPLGLFLLLDEEAMFPQATDETLGMHAFLINYMFEEMQW